MNIEEIGMKVRGIFAQPLEEFRPSAEFNGHINLIHVQISDCSFTEESPIQGVCLLTNNYPSKPDKPEVVGLNIEDALAFMEKHNLAMDGKLTVRRLLVVVGQTASTLRDEIEEIKRHFPSGAKVTIV